MKKSLDTSNLSKNARDKKLRINQEIIVKFFEAIFAKSIDAQFFRTTLFVRMVLLWLEELHEAVYMFT